MKRAVDITFVRCPTCAKVLNDNTTPIGSHATPDGKICKNQSMMPSLVGREADIARLNLADRRLLTLTQAALKLGDKPLPLTRFLGYVVDAIIDYSQVRDIEDFDCRAFPPFNLLVAKLAVLPAMVILCTDDCGRFIGEIEERTQREDLRSVVQPKWPQDCEGQNI